MQIIQSAVEHLGLAFEFEKDVWHEEDVSYVHVNAKYNFETASWNDGFVEAVFQLSRLLRLGNGIQVHSYPDGGYEHQVTISGGWTIVYNLFGIEVSFPSSSYLKQ